MKSRTFFASILLLVFVHLNASSQSQGNITAVERTSPSAVVQSSPTAHPTGTAATQVATKPTEYFIENKGQWDPKAKFLLRSGGMDLWLTENGAVYDLYKMENDTTTAAAAQSSSLTILPLNSTSHVWSDVVHRSHPRSEVPLRSTQDATSFSKHNVERMSPSAIVQPSLAALPTTGGLKSAATQAIQRSGHVIQMTFEGAKNTTATPQTLGLDKQKHYINYFLGNDKAKWASHVGVYASAKITNIYDGIDAVFYLDKGQPRYDIVLAPHADPAQIKMAFKGADAIHVAKDGSLVLKTSMGELKQQGLLAYQMVGGVKQKVQCAFKTIADGRVTFNTANYDKSKGLVIDPLIYSTYLGGSKNETVFGITVDGSGCAYVTGDVGSADFPLTGGAYQTSLHYYDAFVTKLSPDGSAIVYSTYLGGANVESGAAIAVDGFGCAYVTGSTYGGDFPTTVGAFQTSRIGSHSGGGADCFVTKLSNDGATLLYSTYLGGSVSDEPSGIAVDGSGHAYVTGRASQGFPVTAGAFQTSYTLGADGFVTKVSGDGTSLVYSTYLPASCNAIAIDLSGNAYVTGSTGNTYPVTSGAFQTSYGSGFGFGFERGFVSKLSPNGSSLSYSTYLRGSGNDRGSGISVDGSGCAYVTGFTSSNDFPVTSGAYQTSLRGFRNAFLTKVSANGSSLVYSTYLGGSGQEINNAIAMDAAGSACITGSTTSPDFPVTSGAVQTSFSGYRHAFVSRFSSDGTALLYSTLLGGTGAYDIATCVAEDATQNAYVAGLTYSTDFPTTPGSFQTSWAGGSDGFVTKLEMTACFPAISSQPSSVTACAGNSASFAVVALGTSLSYQWQKNGIPIFGATNATYTIPSAQSSDIGTYALVVSGPASGICPSTVTSVPVQLTILSSSTPAITSQPLDATVCPGESAQFSVSASGDGLSYQWRLNGTAIAGATDPTYSIPWAQSTDAGSYDVIVAGACASTSVISGPAQFTVGMFTSQPSNVTTCAGESATFSVLTTSDIFYYEWQKDGQDIWDADPSSPTYSIPSVQTSDAGQYSVIVYGGQCGYDFSNPASLVVNVPPTITAPPPNLVAQTNGDVTLSVGAYGTDLQFGWWREITPISYEVLTDGTDQYTGAIVSGSASPNLTIHNVTAADDGAYHVIITGACGPAYYDPTITVVPDLAAATRCSGTPPAIAVTMSPSTIADDDQMHTVNAKVTIGGDCAPWGVSLISITANEPTGPNDIQNYVYQDDWRNFDLKGHNNGNTTRSYTVVYAVSDNETPPKTATASATVVVAARPVITQQPVGTTVCSGQPFTLSVVASGASLTFQWRKNGVAVTGGDAPSYAISNTTAGMSGTYDCVVTGVGNNSVTTDAVTVTVKTPPTITTQPSNLTVGTGHPMTLTVAATGTGLTYQWQHNGADIPTATNLTYSVASASESDRGVYDVVVSGLCDPPVMSRRALVTVTPPPYFILRPFGQVLPQDGRIDHLSYALLNDLTYDPVSPVAVGCQIQLSNGTSGSELDNIQVCSDQSWLQVSLYPSGPFASCESIPSIDYAVSDAASQVQNIVLSVPNAATMAPGTYSATVRFTSNGALNSPMTLTVRFVRKCNSPTIAVTLAPNSLWPPNNKLNTITATVATTGSCAPLAVNLVSVTANESTASGDIVAATGTNSTTFKVAASRNGSGTGRAYTATYRVTDYAGNVSTATATVRVPHDQGAAKEADASSDNGANVGEDAPRHALQVTVHPNPATNVARICVEDLPEGVPANVVVVDASGATVATLYDATPEAEMGLCCSLDCRLLPNGTYFAYIQNAIMGRAVKIVVQH